MEKLREIYGDSFLRFVLVQDDLDKELSSDQQASLGLLADIVAQSEARDDNDFARQINLSHAMSHYFPDRSTTLGWVLRLQSGGSMSAVEHDDELTRALLTAARDTWPAFLLPTPKDWHSGFRASTFSYPAARTAMRLLLEDEAIRQLFPSAPTETPTDIESLAKIHSNVMFSSGHGGGLQLVMIPDMLLGSARARQFADGNPNDMADFFAKVVTVLDEARKLARGEEITVPKFVGLANMEVSDEIVVEMPFGKLRAPRDNDELVLPSASPSGGGQLTAVLETTSSLKIVHRQSWEEASEDDLTKPLEALRPVFEQYNVRGERNVTMTRYAALLASGEILIAPAQLSQTVFEPLSHMPAQSWAFFVGMPSGISTLDTDASERMKGWADKIGKQHPANLDLGVRRLLSAAGVRLDPVDGFIDAVVCWENMFGSVTESTFRICGAMACLLEPTDKAKRLTLFNALKKLYEARSRVVHGAKELSSQIAYEHRTESIKRALEATRRLYDHPNLLNAKDSAERGRDVLLHMGLDVGIQDVGGAEPESESR